MNLWVADVWYIPNNIGIVLGFYFLCLCSYHHYLLDLFDEFTIQLHLVQPHECPPAVSINQSQMILIRLDYT